MEVLIRFDEIYCEFCVFVEFCDGWFVFDVIGNVLSGRNGVWVEEVW